MRENYTLPRIYLDVRLAEGTELFLGKDQVHYLNNVLRRTAGDDIRVFNGTDGEWQAEITEISRRSATLMTRRQLREPYACPDIWLCFAPVRKHRNAFIMEKATELGVTRLQPVITARTQYGKLRLEKMQSQIIEAAEQTERMDIPELTAAVNLDALLSTWPVGRTLIFADEAGGASPAMDVLKSLSEPAALLIGPEGGFDPEERDRLLDQPFVKPASLGPRILRADTATLSLLTLWQATQGDWK